MHRHKVGVTFLLLAIATLPRASVSAQEQRHIPCRRRLSEGRHQPLRLLLRQQYDV